MLTPERCDHCASLDLYNSAFLSASTKYGIDAALLKAVACNESDINPNAGNSFGAQGIMQVVYRVQGSLFRSRYSQAELRSNPATQIDAGAFILANFLQHTNGDVANALKLYEGSSKVGWDTPIYRTQANPQGTTLRKIVQGILDCQSRMGTLTA